MSKEYLSGHFIPEHNHQKGQLVYASSGVMELHTPEDYWILPPLRGVWIPPGIVHKMITRTRVSFRTLYVNVENLLLLLPKQPVGIAISPLLRELISKASTFPFDYSQNSFEQRLLSLTLEEMLRSEEQGLHLPIAQDKRLRRICCALIANPGDGRSLKEWGDYAGATSRTLTRLFLNEMGMPFTTWRQHLRIIDAIPRLIAGQPISHVAFSLGYSSQAAFTVMFKRATGKVPSSFGSSSSG